MASIGTSPGGRRYIQFVGAEGKRRTLRLGKCDRKTAESVCRHVEALLASKLAGQPIPRQTASWLGAIGAKLRERLARAGLIESPGESGSVMLGEFLTDYIEQRPDVSLGTRQNMRQAARHLTAVLGEKTKLAQVTPADADRFKAWLVSQGLARATVVKCCRIAKHCFAVAVRRKLIAENPFGLLACSHVRNPARQRFVTVDEVQQVLEAVPCRYLRALVVLARWGGLRIPSEAFALRWSDVNWAHGTFIVRSPKTAHHASGGIRIVPLFPEVRAVLDELWQAAPEGEDRVFAGFAVSRPGIRDRLIRYCEQAGVRPWPKIFQNLRATRATELADLYPSHVCAAWLGHTERIADAFYRQVTDEHIRRAIAPPGTPSALQNPMQQMAVTRGTGGQPVHGPLPQADAMQQDAARRIFLQQASVACRGLKARPCRRG